MIASLQAATLPFTLPFTFHSTPSISVCAVTSTFHQLYPKLAVQIYFSIISFPGIPWLRLEPRSHCARRRTSTHARGRTSPYVHVRKCTAMYRIVRRRRTLQILNYILLTIVDSGHNCVPVRRRQRNATCCARFVQNVASVDVRQRSVCERCHRNQRARLQRRRTLTYGDVRRRTKCERGFTLRSCGVQYTACPTTDQNLRSSTITQCATVVQKPTTHCFCSKMFIYVLARLDAQIHRKALQYVTVTGDCKRRTDRRCNRSFCSKQKKRNSDRPDMAMFREPIYYTSTTLC